MLRGRPYAMSYFTLLDMYQETIYHGGQNDYQNNNKKSKIVNFTLKIAGYKIIFRVPS